MTYIQFLITNDSNPFLQSSMHSDTTSMHRRKILSPIIVKIHHKFVEEFGRG